MYIQSVPEPSKFILKNTKNNDFPISKIPDPSLGKENSLPGAEGQQEVLKCKQIIDRHNSHSVALG